MLNHVLCATDRSELAPKLYRHATGIAAAMGASLGIVHVRARDVENALVAHLRDEYLQAIPYGVGYDTDPEIFVPAGEAVSTILLSAQGFHADLIVCGSRRRGPVASWFLGSTSRSLLQRTRIPLLVIPDDEVDVVTLGESHALLHFGCVVAAIDRAESNPDQLAIASQFADVAKQPLALLTVIEPGDDTTLDEANQFLRDRARGLQPVRPTSLIVRRGQVAEEIVRCCTAEGTGLVVLGLRGTSRGARPGAIASAVLNHGRAAVLAVPDSRI
jgi:nucleotide-binding universal stress UspA family protein